MEEEHTDNVVKTHHIVNGMTVKGRIQTGDVVTLNRQPS